MSDVQACHISFILGIYPAKLARRQALLLVHLRATMCSVPRLPFVLRCVLARASVAYSPWQDLLAARGLATFGGSLSSHRPYCVGHGCVAQRSRGDRLPRSATHRPAFETPRDFHTYSALVHVIRRRKALPITGSGPRLQHVLVELAPCFAGKAPTLRSHRAHRRCRVLGVGLPSHA